MNIHIKMEARDVILIYEAVHECPPTCPHWHPKRQAWLEAALEEFKNKLMKNLINTYLWRSGPIE